MSKSHLRRFHALADRLDLVAAVDSAPAQVGRPMYEALGLDRPGGPAIEADAEQALAAVQPQLVLHATGSFLPDVLPQLLACVRAGANVVSTCEELSYPWLRHPELAKQLDDEAKARGVAVLGGDGISDAWPSITEGWRSPIHQLTLVLMGVHLIDNMQLSRLAEACAERQRWEFLLTVAPLRLELGTASPVNPIALF